ncbi:transmembrane emp24 domain-containing protein 7-like [Contarinia nasturtii]|uniref:transmembrane emp24 domain-containing protein 7-like n=1 Tax=Contarinia nasturtii TaxID=265458 RepID=UPI0012D4ACB2|nr:transmembrane emp24 domain-containing protein 7-like [Contarinia nasturtii]
MYLKLICLFMAYHAVMGTEFAFDLAKSAVECFYEEINENTPCILEFQVLKGGALDVDVIIQAPSKLLIYKELRKEHDRFKFNTTESGVHRICFNNEFSTFTEKSIFVSFEAGRLNRLLHSVEEDTEEVTFMNETAQSIHIHLQVASILQTDYRRLESKGRHFAEDLNGRVLTWSLVQTIIIIVIGLSQVIILRTFFNDPKPKTSISLSHHTQVYG